MVERGELFQWFIYLDKIRKAAKSREVEQEEVDNFTWQLSAYIREARKRRFLVQQCKDSDGHALATPYTAGRYFPEFGNTSLWGKSVIFRGTLMGMKRRGKGVTMLEGGGGDVRARSISSREVAESSICYGQKRVNA